MKQIRKSIFETNSSSCHSFTIDFDSGIFDTLFVDSDGWITFIGGEFGWEEETYYDAQTRANYCAVFVELCRCDNPRFKEMFENVIKQMTGAKYINYNFTQEYNNNYSYIDHQSLDDIEDFIFENEESLKHFIFGRHSTLTTDNDNH